MHSGGFARAEAPTRGLFWLTGITFVLALVVGGGQGSLIEHLLALPGLALMIATALRVMALPVKADRARWVWLLPAGLLLLPLLQLVPLPQVLWTALPGRSALADGLAAAGVTPGAGAWTLVPFFTEKILWSALVPVGVFVAATTLHGAQRRTLVGIALAFAAISALVGLWQVIEGPKSSLYLYRVTNEGEAVGLFANRNHLAGFLAATLPVAAGLLADRLRHHPHGVRDLKIWLLTGVIVLLSVSVTATHSRAGFALLMVSVIASAALLLRARSPGGGSAGARAWLQASALIAGVLIVQLTLYGLLARLEADPLDDYRRTLTANTVQAAEPAKGLGFGLGTFRYAYDEIGDASADVEPYVNHAHNDYAELWLEGGALAMLLVLVALALIVAQLRKFLRNADMHQGEDRHHRGLKLGAALSLLLIALHSLVDYPLRTVTIDAYAALLAAVLLGSVCQNPRSEGSRLANPL